MLLAIDVGNTNVVFAVFNGDNILGRWRLSTDPRRTADEYAILLKELMALQSLEFSQITAIILSSVVPQSQRSLYNFCTRYFNCKPLCVGEEGVKLGMKILLDTPAEVGADRLVNAVAAFQKHQRACILLDFGTATTFDVISPTGDYLGGMIAPGINLSLDALHRAAAKLPEISIEKPKQVIGKSTVAAMQAGIYYGYLGMIEGIVRHVKAEAGFPDMLTIATGGLAPLFADATPVIDEWDADLTINGLYHIFNLNN